MRKWLAGLLAFLFLGSVMAYTSIFRISKNFYEIDPHKFYRSAQLTPKELEATVKQYGIKTVISLRGLPQPIFGGESEVALLDRLGVAFQKYDLSTDYYPKKADLVSIVEAFKTAPKPILIHCRTGADRTGMISALYQIEEMGFQKSKALKQLSFKYWHVRQFHPAMTSFVNLYQGAKWVSESYDPCKLDREFLEHPDECVRDTAL